MPTPGPLHLTSEWFIKAGSEHLVPPIIAQLVAEVHAGEPDTLIYLVHTPLLAPATTLQSLPPPAPNSILFFEVYRDETAFQQHLNGPIFTRFVADHGCLFIHANKQPFTFVEFLRLQHGYVRAAAAPFVNTAPP